VSQCLTWKWLKRPKLPRYEAKSLRQSGSANTEAFCFDPALDGIALPRSWQNQFLMIFFLEGDVPVCPTAKSRS
jgi:hypothetical protein